MVLKLKVQAFNLKKIVGDVEYSLEVCEKCLLEKFPDLNGKKRYFNTTSKHAQWAFGVSDEDLKAQKDYSKSTLENFQRKWGLEEGKIRWDNFCKKNAETNTFRYKQKNNNWTREDFDKYNKSRAVTLENLIEKYGENKGKEVWEKYKFRQGYTNTLAYFTEKYGEKEGRLKYSEISYAKSFGGAKYSSLSQELFKSLELLFLPKKWEIWYPSSRTNKEEYQIFSKERRYIYYLDFYIADLSLNIEFNGDIFHANPEIYSLTDRPNPFKKDLTSEEIWIKDKIRIENIKKYHNIDTIVIWEKDFKSNSFNILDLYKKIINLEKEKLVINDRTNN